MVETSNKLLTPLLKQEILEKPSIKWQYKFLSILPYLPGEVLEISEVLDFFEFENEYELMAYIEKSESKYRCKNNLNFCGLLQYAYNKLKAANFIMKFDKEGLAKWMKEGKFQEHFLEPDYFSNILPSELEKFGVFLVLAPYTEGTCYHFVKWIKSTPIFTITDKRNNLANAWMSFYYGLFYILSNPGETFIDDEPGYICQYKNPIKSKAYTYMLRHLLRGDSDFLDFVFRQKGLNNIYDIEVLQEKYKISKLFITFFLNFYKKPGEKYEPNIFISFKNKLGSC